jgi:FMN phosphatase YigB (HAD superfamily)
VSDPQPPRLIVLDAGDTLVSCIGPTRSAQLRRSSPLDGDDVRTHVHTNLLTRPVEQFTTAFIQATCERLQVPYEKFPYRPGWPAPETYQLREDAAAGVAMFRRLAPVVVLSNVSAFDDIGSFLCSSLGFGLDDIYTSHHIGLSKPDPRAFRFVAEDRRVATGDLLVVGDSWHNDVQGGRGVGARQCWLQHNGGRQRPEVIDGTIVSASLTKLAREAKRHWWPYAEPLRAPAGQLPRR